MVLLLALAAAPAPAIAVEPAGLHFAVEARAGMTARLTPPQVVFLENGGGDTVPWSATVDRDWLRLGTLSGTAPATLVVDVPLALVPKARDEALVTFTFGAGADAITRTLRVTLDVLSEGHAPIGAFDQPADGTTVSGGGLRLSGWALDDVGLADVEICRDPLPRSQPGAGCGAALLRLGPATFYDAARPDVASAYPSAPGSDRSGWTYVLDTGAWPRSARGTFRVYAAARDVEGHTTVLGSKSLTVEPGEAQGFSFTALAAVLGPVVLVAVALHLWLRTRGSRLPAAVDGDTRPPVSPVSPIEGAAITAIVALAALIQLPAMRVGLAYDELYTVRHFVADRSFWQAASTVGVFNNHIAYSVLAVASVRLLGMSEWALRLPALALGAAGVYALWRFVRAFAGPGAALLSALLLALSPMHVAWSRSARGYTGLALMTIVSSYKFFDLLRQPSPRAAVGHALATSGGIYFHLYGIWAGVIQYALFALLAVRSRISAGSFRLLWRSFAAVLVTTVLLYSPVVLDLTAVGKERGRTGVQTGFPLALFDAIAGADGAWLRALAAMLVVAGFVRLRTRALHATYFALLLVVPLSVAWLVLRPVDLHARFFEFWTPAFCAVVAVAILGPGGAGFRRRDAVFVIPAAVMGLILLVNWVGRDLQPVPASGYREALGARADAPAGARTFVVGADAGMLAYYLRPPVASLESVEELERAMRQPPFELTVAYHDVTWNAPEHQRIAELLSRRCRRVSSGPVRMFRCGI